MSRIWRALKDAERHKSGTSLGRQAEEKVNESTDRRASKRRAHQAVLLVYGSDAEKQPFHEECETLDINEDGCSLLLEAPIVRGQRLVLANTLNQAELQARVIHVGHRVRGKSRIGVEFLRRAPEFWLAS